MPPIGRKELPSVAVLGAAAVLFVALARFCSKQIGDDAFIFFRVAENLRAGHGPVFNPGERVEAYSSPAWLAVLAAARSLGVGYETTSRALGPLLCAAAFALGVAIARRLGAGLLAASSVALFGAISGTLHYWAPAGLEMPLYALALTSASAGVAFGRPWLWAAGTALAGVTRPEGIVLVFVCAAAMLLGRGDPRLRFAHVALALSPALFYEVFRLSYFGAPLPNTYYAKATGALGERLEVGLDYAFWVLVPLVPSMVYALARWRRGDPIAAAVSMPGAAVVGAAILGGGDWMWGHRLLVPALPALSAVFVAQAWSLLGARSVRLAHAAAFAILGLATNDDLAWPERIGYELHFGFNRHNLCLKFRRARDYVDGAKLRFVRPLETIARALRGDTMDPGERMEGTLTETSREVGRFLASRYPPGTLIAVNHAGAVPYYAGLPALDMTGLADRHIARDVAGGLHEKYDPAYVLARAPRAVVLNSRVEPGKDGVFYHKGYWVGETALVEHEGFARRYRALPEFFRWEYSDRKGNFILCTSGSIHERAHAPPRRVGRRARRARAARPARRVRQVRFEKRIGAVDLYRRRRGEACVASAPVCPHRPVNHWGGSIDVPMPAVAGADRCVSP